MKGLKISFLVAFICLVASFSYADIYEWTDENGVRHFTNFAPPDQAKIVIQTHEIPYDAEADQARWEAEQEERLSLARQEIAEREAALDRREAEAARLLAEAGREAEERLQITEERPDESTGSRSARSRSRHIVYCRFCYPPHLAGRGPCSGDNDNGFRPDPYAVKNCRRIDLAEPYTGFQNRYDLSTFPRKLRYTLKKPSSAPRVSAPDRSRYAPRSTRSGDNNAPGRNGFGGMRIIFGRQ